MTQIRVILLLLCISAISRSQQPAGPAVDLAGYFGGVSVNNGYGHNPLLGASVAAGSRRVMVFGEANYVPIQGDKDRLWISGEPSVTVWTSLKAVDFGGGVSVALFSGSSVEPYVIGGFGATRVSASIKAQQSAVPSGSAAISVSATDTTSRISGGVGIRFYLGGSWGVRPEIRLDRYLSDEASTALRYSLGVFYRWGR
jgi:hypothetical protein